MTFDWFALGVFVSSIDRLRNENIELVSRLICFLCVGREENCIQSGERVVILLSVCVSLFVTLALCFSRFRFYDQKKNERMKDVRWMSEKVLDRLLMSFRTSNTHLWPKHCSYKRTTISRFENNFYSFAQCEHYHCSSVNIEQSIDHAETWIVRHSWNTLDYSLKKMC